MSLFDSLGKTPTPAPAANGSSNPMQVLSQLRSNPIQMLSKAGYNVPENIGNNPQAIVQHLLNTNQITQQRLNQSQIMANRMMGRR